MENDVELKSKFSNIFIMILTGLMENDMTNVKHYLSDELFTRYQGRCDNFKENKEYQCYGEPNVGDIKILRKYDDLVYNYVEVDLLSKYMDYVIDMDTLEFKRGIRDHRVELHHLMIFRKRKDAKERTEIVKCPNCGASLDINYSGKCEFCGTITSVSSFDYVLTTITNL